TNRRSQPHDLSVNNAFKSDHLGALDRRSGIRINDVNFDIPLPAHVALTGDSDGVAAFAAVLGGVVEPSSGSLTIGGINLLDVPAVKRARRIGYVGAGALLFDARLGENLRYGVPEGETVSDETLQEALKVAGIDGEVFRLGLANSIDPTVEERL